jgi:hypothetical protein
MPKLDSSAPNPSFDTLHRSFESRLERFSPPAAAVRFRPFRPGITLRSDTSALGLAGHQPAARSAARDRCCYLPREVFFGRLGFAGAFFTVWASDFERFLPATSDSFPIAVLPGAPYRGSLALRRVPASAWPGSTP